MRRNGRGDGTIQRVSGKVGSRHRSGNGKTRPCVIVSPNEVNRALDTIIIAPMTTTRRGWPTRVQLNFQGKIGEVALDHLRAVDKTRLVKRLGKLESVAATAILDTLGEMFAP